MMQFKTTLQNGMFMIFSLCFFFSNGVYAAVTSWTGASSTSWHASSNWTNGIPTSSTDVVINVTSRAPKISTSSAYCRKLTIASGAVLSLDEDLTVYGDIENNGTVNISNNDFELVGIVSLSGTGEFVESNGEFNVKNSGTIVTILSGSNLTFPDVEIDDDAILINKGSAIFTDDLSGDGTFTNYDNANTIVYDNVECDITTSSVVNSFSYAGSGGQEVKGATYYNLNLSTSGSKTAKGDITVNGDLTISGTADLKGGSHTVYLRGSAIFNNEKPAPEIVFNHPSATQYISLNSASTKAQFADITINKAAGKVVLLGNASTDGTLKFTSGKLDLNGFVFSIESNGSISGETESNCIIGGSGTITASATINGNTKNVGNLGVTINANGANLGTVTVTRGHAAQTAINGKTSFNRYYDITISGTNSGLNATITYNYFNNELNGQAASNLRLYKSTDGGLTWTESAGANTTFSASSKTITVTGVSSFSRWTGSNSSTNPLPVIFEDFNGKFSGQSVTLQWTTSMEVNNKAFQVEMSTDGSNYTTIAQVEGNGTTNSAHHYTYLHSNVEADVVYYRLNQVDHDGKSELSKVIIVSKLNSENQDFSVFPNPNKGSDLYLSYHHFEQEPFSIAIYDMNEKLHYSEEFNLQGAGITRLYMIEQQKLAAGIYLVRIKTAAGLKNMKLVVE